MKLSRELTIVAVHGEGNRDKVNKNKAALNKAAKIEHIRRSQEAPADLDKDPDEPGQVTIVLRGEADHDRVEIHLNAWDEIEAWKKLGGYNAEKDHWATGGKITLTLGA